MFFEPFPKASYLDQITHTLAGLLLTILFLSFGLVWWYAILVTMTFALTREMLQHPLRITPGSRTDLAFWLIGSVLGMLI